VGLLVGALPERARGARLREVGTSFGSGLARQARLRPAKRFDTALRRACAAVGRLGYHASVVEVTDGEAVLSTSICPLRPLVRAHPELAELDRSMWAALVAEALEGHDAVDVDCETHRCLDDQAECRLVVRLRPAFK
jgi:hypothetical protein